MDVNDLFPSKYLKHTDAEPDIIVTISRITQEKMKNNDGEEEQKPVIYFSEQEKGMVLNRTNANTLAELFGSDIGNWTGERVTLTSVEVDAFGKMQKALRFKAASPKISREELVKRYQKLYEQAKKLEVDHLETYVIAADAPEATIMELGKMLKKAVQAANVF